MAYTGPFRSITCTLTVPHQLIKAPMTTPVSTERPDRAATALKFGALLALAAFAFFLLRGINDDTRARCTALLRHAHTATDSMVVVLSRTCDYLVP